jgi:hypothetical protein
MQLHVEIQLKINLIFRLIIILYLIHLNPSHTIDYLMLAFRDLLLCQIELLHASYVLLLSSGRDSILTIYYILPDFSSLNIILYG